MTLTIMAELEQGSEAWHTARRGLVTASSVGKLLTLEPPSAVTVDCPKCKASAGSPCISLARKEPTPVKTYTFGLTVDTWWPPHRSTRVLGRSRIVCTCCVCGTREVLSIRIPRIGKVPTPASGRHPARERFLADHAHPDRGHPMSWALPLRNPVVFGSKGINLNLLAMRLEADAAGDEGSTS